MGIKKRWKKALLIGMVLSFMIPLIAACSKSPSNSDNAPRTLRFASSNGWIGENGEAFREYTEIFQFMNPNIELEYVQTTNEDRYSYYYYMSDPGDEEYEDPVEALKEAMTGPTPPDIVMLQYEHLPQLVNENLLVSLDELIAQEDDFNVEDFVPAVINGLREQGNGTLYALAPNFYASAVIYNKNIFAQQGVEFPQDNMTWDEMFDLARRVTVVDEDNPVYGFSFNTYNSGGPYDLFYNMSTYTAPLGISWVDVDSLQMTANTPTWQGIWKTFIDLYNEGVFPQEVDYSRQREYHPLDHDLFLSGKLAMAITHYGYLNEVINANRNADRIENFEAIDWDIVTLPTHVDEPGVGANIYYQGIFAINANAENPEDAWEFIKFVNGEDWARTKSESSYNLVSRQSYIKPKEGLDYNIEAFLALSPPRFTNNEYVLYEKLRDYWQVQSIGQMKFMQAINEEKSIELALQEWETEGQAMIQQLLEQRQSQGDDDMGTLPAMEEEMMDAFDESFDIETEVDTDIDMEMEMDMEMDMGAETGDSAEAGTVEE